MVDCFLIQLLAGHPHGIDKQLILNADVVVDGLLRHGVIPRFVIANLPHIGVDLSFYTPIFSSRRAVIDSFVPRIAHDAQGVAHHPSFHGFETYRDIFPTAVKVFRRQSTGVGELITFVLVVNLVVHALLRGDKTETEQTVLLLLSRWNADAFGHRMLQVHIQTNRAAAAEVGHRTKVAVDALADEKGGHHGEQSNNEKEKGAFFHCLTILVTLLLTFRK